MVITSKQSLDHAKDLDQLFGMWLEEPNGERNFHCFCKRGLRAVACKVLEVYKFKRSYKDSFSFK